MQHIHKHNAIPGTHLGRVTEVGDQLVSHEYWRDAVDRFNLVLKDLEARCESTTANIPQLADELALHVRNVESICRAWEQQFGSDPEALRAKQDEFRRLTDESFAKSFFMHRARLWPQGYPGDYEIIEKAYNNQPLSHGLGRLLDLYFLNTTLAHGIRYRRARMRELLAEEMQRRPGARVLNIGCGPCREVVELAPVIRETGAHFTCVDFDPDALVYSADRMLGCGLENHVAFRQYNALRMVSAPRNIAEFGRFDVIYTIGLLDYLTDEVLVRMIRSLRETLYPGGTLVAVFKDCERYDTIDYHWLVKWNGFLQRTRHESWDVLEKAGVPQDAVTIQRSQDDVMIFYRVLRSGEKSTRTTVQDSHTRMDQAIDPITRQPSTRPRRAKRDTPSERRNT